MGPCLPQQGSKDVRRMRYGGYGACKCQCSQWECRRSLGPQDARSVQAVLCKTA